MRLMVKLALHYGEGPVFLKDIAKKEHISEKYLSQIVIILKGGGLINSFRGAHGGYVLSRPPAHIKLGEIVSLLEGSLCLVSCVNDTSACARVSICATRMLWKKIEERISQILNSETLEDLIRIHREKLKGVYTYNI